MEIVVRPFTKPQVLLDEPLVDLDAVLPSPAWGNTDMSTIRPLIVDARSFHAWYGPNHVQRGAQL